MSCAGLSQNISMPCNMCDREHEAVARCLTCLGNLCGYCTFSHEVMKCFIGHKVVYLSETANGSGTDPPDEGSSGCGAANTCSHAVNPTKKMKFKKVFSDKLQALVYDITRQYLVTTAKINELCEDWQRHLFLRESMILSPTDLRCIRQFDLINVETAKIEEALLNIQHALWSFDFDSDEEAASNSHIPSTSSSAPSSSNNDPETSSAFNFRNSPSTSHMESDANNNVASRESSSVFLSSKNPFERSFKPDMNPSIRNPNCFSVDLNRARSIHLEKTVGKRGHGAGSFQSPHGFCLGPNEDIVIVDSSNHLIQIFENSGRYKFQFGTAGRHEGQLWYPRKIAYLPCQRCFAVCDRGYERSRLQLFSEFGMYIKKISIHYIDIVAGIAVTSTEGIVLVDSVTPTIFIIGPNDFLRTIDCKPFMVEPSDVVSCGKQLFVCDFKGHCIVTLDDEGNFLRKIENQTANWYPNGIDVSLNGEILVGDSHGNFFHIVIYSKDGDKIREFRCPDIKVSRCCGLHITSTGRIITVDKNYHHAIVFNTL